MFPSKQRAFFNSRKEVHGSSRTVDAVCVDPCALIQEAINGWKRVLPSCLEMVEEITPLLMERIAPTGVDRCCRTAAGAVSYTHLTLPTTEAV